MSDTTVVEMQSHGSQSASIPAKTQFAIEFTQEEAKGIRNIAEALDVCEEDIVKFSLRHCLGFNCYKNFSREDIFVGLVSHIEDGEFDREWYTINF
ncbi:hypothetical protein H5P28_09010 [Ruficoccus amylovorans]|uniref:Uncharacterized protein n=1 Tax=Ruficoccus amylovorans TaxID=1804625 RepID=A0A842HFT7_9BACT|nr:hypothetical protein [Ruficoccus amylovorans]MBC2594394.1 hypothetical protein [Ruficoccus amylovorans]